MKLFEKNNKYEDERIKLQRIKIVNEAFYILIFALFISMFIKQFVFKMNFSSYVTEYILIPSCGFYVGFRCLWAGHKIKRNTKKSMILTSLIYSIILGTLAFIGSISKNNLSKAIITSAIFFISVFVLIMIILVISDKLSNNRLKKFENELEED